MAGLKQLGYGVCAIAMVWATPALAVTTTTVVITENQQEVPTSRIQLFNAATGVQVQPEEDDDDEAGAVFLLDGGRYRVVVDGRTVQEIGVTGSGTQRFAISMPSPIAPLPPPGPSVLLSDEQRNIGTGDFNRELNDNFVAILFSGGQADIPQTGTGFMRDGPSGSASETFGQTTPAKVTMLGVNLSAGFRNLAMNIHYAEGDADNSFTVPNSLNSGIVFGDDAPSGSSGLATPFGLSGETEVENRIYGAQFELGLYGGGASQSRWFDGGGSPETSGAGSRTGVSAYVSVEHLDRDYRGFSSFSGTSGSSSFTGSQDRNQQLSENRFGAGLSGSIVTALGGPLFGHLTGSAGGFYWDSDLNSVELNTSNYGPSSDRNFTIEINDSDNGFGLRGEVGAGLELRLSPALSLFAGGSVDYVSETASIFNPNSGDQVFFDDLNTELNNDKSWSWSAQFGVVVRPR